MYKYIYIYVCVCVCVYIYMHIYIHIFSYIYIYIGVRGGGDLAFEGHVVLLEFALHDMYTFIYIYR